MKRRNREKGKSSKMIDESCTMRGSNEHEGKINVRNDILTEVARDETSVDFSGLQVLPGGSKGSICTQVPPAKTARASSSFH